MGHEEGGREEVGAWRGGEMRAWRGEERSGGGEENGDGRGRRSCPFCLLAVINALVAAYNGLTERKDGLQYG